MTDPLISASSSLLVRLIGDIIKTASKSVALELEIFKTPAKIKSLSKKLASYEQVKTIQSPDRASKLSSFFVSPSFVDSDNRIFDAKLVSDFGHSEHPLIEGIAGQGKSIFMRQLLLEEIKLGQRLPILIELRKITSQKDLRQSGIQFLRALGFCRCEDIWSYLLEAGFAVLLLDGYDETPEECRMQLIDDISTLAMTYDQLRMVVTSRPEPSIKSVSCLKTIRICRLSKSKRDAIIKKICDPATASNLIVKLDKNPSLNEIVDTPLFATLLSIVYRAELRLPETVHEFYDLVFQTLLYRHDDHKEGFERPRKSGLGNHMFRMVFENYCFRTSLNAQLRFSQETATEIFALALAKEGADLQLADKFFTDVTKITCLLVRDGSEYQFLHKSIQEYFSAGYIKRLPEDKARDFYGRILNSPHRITQLFQAILFLCEIDSYRAYKYFMLPGLSLSILKDDNRWSELSSHEWTSDLIFDILQDCTPLFNLNIDNDGKAVQRGITVLGSTWSSRFIFLDYFRLIILILTSIADSLQARINSNPEALLEFPADVIQKEYDPDEPSLRRCIQVICSHALFVTLQDDIVTTVNQSDIMRDFRVKVSSMLELLLRNEDSDLLDQI